MTDAAKNEPVNDKAPAEVDYLEFVGGEPYGTEFYSSHTITDKHMREYHNVGLGKREVVWNKGANGRMLVPVSDLSAEAVEVLAADPLFKRVKL